ncbi:tetratricopeptide repeat protein [Methylobacterium radiodurans]|uniref:tetratricopeptide repeat protein n=1 Tax=Methylobacterium radiodurans TaxID=2202828 RepID=UPI0013A53B10|nr:hypothetical protein [Methylobacterium radiodurans]
MSSASVGPAKPPASAVRPSATGNDPILNNALRIKPGDVHILDSCALVHLKPGTHDRAIADYSAALATKANSANVLHGRGIARQRSGDKLGSDADMARARAIQADIAQVYAGYGVE